MNKKGFTLIELLAVIVILAIIALIAVPIILNIIDSSKESANQRSKELYLDAVEQAIAREKMKDIDFNPTSCTVQENGDLTCVGYKEPLKVETTGSKPNEGGTITLQNGKVIENTLVFGDNSSGGNTEEASKICQLASDSEKQGYEIGAKYTCSLDKARTFYVLETSEEKISLLMEQNFTDGDGTNGTIPPTVAWCTDGTKDENTCKNISTTGSEAPDGKDYIGHITSIFNKEEIEVSFPTAEQIASADGKNYLDWPTLESEWLYDYLYGTTNSVDGVCGYWTTTPNAGGSNYAWYVYYFQADGYGSMNYDDYFDLDSSYGVRPVITVSKSSLN